MNNINQEREVNMRKVSLIIIAAFFLFCLAACGDSPDKKNSGTTVPVVKDQQQFKAAYSKTGLPGQLKWQTNDQDPTYASLAAQKGGALRLSLMSFPMTFRVVGPDSNGSFRGAILGNQYGLISVHPNTENIVPEIATHWAFGDDKKTMYFKLDPKARWSDGVPVIASDFAYTLTFMRSKHIFFLF